ncbi:type III pantothenate kinase [Phycisphaera mikurensis]|uniref:Type III pantothenate kinase n=1 Tax=Phycisphaera mikurensis (strain NBRC 102666 / KCTC 22515 / FYK2301M01) TaxID=1142394 RepID=I0IDJ9_PHYMF|nr:type III pantothenate kinase [Phycisphaera mikurensis]MBB6441157.1 type III pantothenate kinase [Phycisphaera mikurensis]BAM03337.1 type III pantothenate kinase [Phycisphaera mikurensis NBRC 102666]
MPMNLLAVSVGNTRTRVGAFADDQLTWSATVENLKAADVKEAVIEAGQSFPIEEPYAAVISSVNRVVSDRLLGQLEGRVRANFLRMERDVPVPIGRQLDPEAIVGEDRLLCAAAAYAVLKQACVVVDAGTAVTVDFVDGAGTFHGGAIAPGGQMMMDALQAGTDALPEADFEKPVEVPGHNTIEAMRAGVYHGLRGMVHELVEKYAELAGAFPLVVVTGGDGALLFKDDERVDRVVPDLVLTGIQLAWKTMVAAAEEDDDGAA